MNKSPILITGSHRSGTTWTGRILGKSRWLRYIHEPFNPSKNKKSPIQTWFQYISIDTTSQTYQDEIVNYLKSFHNFSFSRLVAKCKSAKYPRQVIANIKNEIKGFYGRPLYKDPIAVFSAEWFYKKMNANIIICIRHPAAFVSSLKNLEWTFNFDELLRQEAVLMEYINPFRAEISQLQKQELTKKKPDIVGQGIILWNIIYLYTYRLQLKYGDNPNWTFLKHEDLSKEPLQEFEKLFRRLNVPFNQKIKTAILETTQLNETNFRAKDAVNNILIWKERLTDAEIERIKHETGDVWKFYYKEKDWQ